MHPSKNQQHNSYFHAFQFDHLSQGRERICSLERQSDIANINEVEPYNKQMVYRVCQLFIAMESINQKDPSIAMERTRYPYSKGNADSKIAEIASRDIHIGKPSLRIILNTFS